MRFPFLFQGKTQTEEKASEIEAFVMPTADQFMQLLAHLDSDPFPRQAIKDRFFTAFRALSSDTFPTEHIVIAATNVLTGFTSSIGAPVPIHTLTEEQKALDLLNEQDLKQVWKLLQEDMSEQLRPHVSQLKLQAACEFPPEIIEYLPISLSPPSGEFLDLCLHPSIRDSMFRCVVEQCNSATPSSSERLSKLWRKTKPIWHLVSSAPWFW